MGRDDVLDLPAVAELIGVAVGVAHNYRQDGRLPVPDGFVSGRPWWHRGTIVDWQSSRPGRGNWRG